MLEQRWRDRQGGSWVDKGGNLVGLIESNRRAIDGNTRVRRYASPALFSLETKLIPRLKQNATGDLLDLGCGEMPYRNVVIDQVTSYDGLDIEPRSRTVKYVTSVTDMGPVPDSSYDTVVCTELLEHVEDPTHVAAEICRVLRPGGRLVLTVPFLGRLHEEPRDFYRYTRHGLLSIFSESGFNVEEIVEHGSLGSLLGHQVSTVIVGVTWHIPVIKWLVMVVNVLLVVGPAMLLDGLSPRLRRKMPLGYVMVAAKPDAIRRNGV